MRKLRVQRKDARSVWETTATLTSKGQVTIPVSIRRELNLKEGDQLLFVREAGRFYIEKIPGEVSSDQVFGKLNRPNIPPLNIERARVKARFLRSSRHLTGGNPEDE